MVNRISHVLAALLLLSTTAAAQGLSEGQLAPALPTAGERRAADVVSWGLVLGAIAWDTKVSCLDAEDKRAGCLKEAARIGLTEAAVWAIKAAVHRERPDGSGSDSFLSGHTANACQALGGLPGAWGISFCLGTGEGRILAGKHWLTDTLAGAGLGWAVSHLH